MCFAITHSEPRDEDHNSDDIFNIKSVQTIYSVMSNLKPIHETLPIQFLVFLVS